MFFLWVFVFKVKIIPAGCSREITRVMQLLFQSRSFYEVGTALYVCCCLLPGAKLALQELNFGSNMCSRPMPEVWCLITSGHTIHSS